MLIESTYWIIFITLGNTSWCQKWNQYVINIPTLKSRQGEFANFFGIELVTSSLHFPQSNKESETL